MPGHVSLAEAVLTWQVVWLFCTSHGDSRGNIAINDHSVSDNVIVTKIYVED